MSKSKQSPMYKQYKELKAAYPKAMLLYRLGDFYELFEDDAELGARELSLTLTQRRFAKNVTMPMAGFPHRYLNSYLARLIKKGHMVAVADQLEDARQAKGLVKRGITRVVTSGTVMDDSLLKENRENFLLAVAPEKNTYPCDQIGLAFLDLSTGAFHCTQLAAADLMEEVTRIQPSEVILPRSLYEQDGFTQSFMNLGVARLSPLESADFQLNKAQQTLQAQFKVVSLEAYGRSPLAFIAAAAVLHYLQSNRFSDLDHITNLITYELPDFLTIDLITRRNLELMQTLREGKHEGSLLSVLDQTQTRMGARLLRRWINHPLSHQTRIEMRLNAVETFVKDAFLRQDIRDVLQGIYDLERLAGRVGSGNANARDLINLKASLLRVPRMKTLLAGLSDSASDLNSASLLTDITQKLDPMQNITQLIDQALADEPPILITDGGLIKETYHPELIALRQKARDGRTWLNDYETAERERTGIKNLRLKHNSVFGFFIEVTKSNLDRVPESYQRRATIATGERFITSELKTQETEILAAEDEANRLEYDLFLDLRQQVAQNLSSLRQTAQALAQLDVLATFAEVAALHNYVKPTLTPDPILELHEARHPVVEQLISSEAPFIPNDCHLKPQQSLLVLTGPNMSGKSVYLRQTALAVLLAHIGSFVSAREATIGLSDRIFARAGASDDISQGRSTFLVEMSETAHILHHATEHSLIILDEVGRGTSTYDGLSLAWAVAEDIQVTLNARCLFATHFHELTALGEHLAGAKNYSMAVHEQDGHVIFLRQLIDGGADQSYGIHVARLAGLPQRVLAKAQQILAGLEMRSQKPASETNVGLPPETTESLKYQPSGLGSNLRLAEASTVYHVGHSADDTPSSGPYFPLPVEEQQLWAVLQDLYQLDVANLTPMDALIHLNEWQQRLKSSKVVKW